MSDQFFTQSEVYPWQQETWQRLTMRFPNIAHGILLHGKAGAGKHDFVLHFIAWLLCLDQHPLGACGVCQSCQWLKSNTHPNYVNISTHDDKKPDQTHIKIDQIRALQPFIQQTVEGWRVVLIQPAEALNMAAANALLKTLEEPGDRTVIILVTDHLLQLPATIRSRLQRYALDRIPSKIAVDYIRQYEPNLADQQIQLLLNLAHDMPLQARHLLSQPWLKQREMFLADWLYLVKHKNGLVTCAMKWSKELKFLDFCSMLQYLLTDLICLKLNQSVKNIDLNFSDILPYYDLDVLFAISHKLHDAKAYTQQNVQTQFIIDDLFVMLLNISSNNSALIRK